MIPANFGPVLMADAMPWPAQESADGSYVVDMLPALLLRGFWCNSCSAPAAAATLGNMTQTWEAGQIGVLSPLRPPDPRPRPDQAASGGPHPDFGVYLLGKAPTPFGWDSRWVRWRDLRLPADDADTLGALKDAWRRAADERVEVACLGGRGRTGTALACIAILDGVPPADAVAFVRRHYRPGAVETPWQRRYVARFQGPKA